MAQTAGSDTSAQPVSKVENGLANSGNDSADKKTATQINGSANDDKLRLAKQRADENAKKIAAQIEYYLGDFNLIQDKFFRDMVQKDEGWVPIDAIMKCNRVKKFTSNPADVVPSLEKFSTAFDIDSTGMRIKRKQAYVGDTESAQTERDDRTVHVKRFMKSATVDSMQDYFSKFGQIDGLVLNKFQEGDAKVRGKFKGSVFCIFKNKSDAEKYLAASPEETKFEGNEMIREWKKNHLADQEKRTTEKKKQIEETKIPGSVLHVSTQRTIDYLKLKEFFNQRQPVEYVDHQRGQREARVRFKAGVAKEVMDNLLAHNNNKLVIDGVQYKGRVLGGQEEQNYFDSYWDTFLEAKNNKILRNMRNDPKSQFKYQCAKKDGHSHSTSKSQSTEDGKDSAKETAAAVKEPSGNADAGVTAGEAVKSEGVSSSEIESDPAGRKRPADDSDTTDTKKSKLDSGMTDANF